MIALSLYELSHRLKQRRLKIVRLPIDEVILEEIEKVSGPQRPSGPMKSVCRFATDVAPAGEHLGDRLPDGAQDRPIAEVPQQPARDVRFNEPFLAKKLTQFFDVLGKPERVGHQVNRVQIESRGEPGGESLAASLWNMQVEDLADFFFTHSSSRLN